MGVSFWVEAVAPTHAGALTGSPVGLTAWDQRIGTRCCARRSQPVWSVVAARGRCRCRPGARRRACRRRRRRRGCRRRCRRRAGRCGRRRTGGRCRPRPRAGRHPCGRRGRRCPPRRWPGRCPAPRSMVSSPPPPQTMSAPPPRGDRRPAPGVPRITSAPAGRDLALGQVDGDGPARAGDRPAGRRGDWIPAMSSWASVRSTPDDRAAHDRPVGAGLERALGRRGVGQAEGVAELVQGDALEVDAAAARGPALRVVEVEVARRRRAVRGRVEGVGRRAARAVEVGVVGAAAVVAGAEADADVGGLAVRRRRRPGRSRRPG